MTPIIGTSITKFGDLWEKSLRDLIRESGLGALKDAGLSAKDIDVLYISNVLAQMTSGSSTLSSMAFDEL